MVAIIAKTFDLSGVLSLGKVRQTAPEVTRRVSRTKTIDGGVTIQDSGSSQGDRTFVLNIDSIDKVTADKATYLTENYSELYLATEEGYFIGVIERFYIKTGGVGSITMLVKSKVN